MLDIQIKESGLTLYDQTLCLEMGLHSGILLFLELDALLDPEGKEGQRLLKSFYDYQLKRLLLLPPRDSQWLLQELSLEGLACLFNLLQGTTTAQQLRKNLSARRLQQLEEEPVYRASSPPDKDLLKKALAPFFDPLEERIASGDLLLPDPDEPYFK